MIDKGFHSIQIVYIIFPLARLTLKSMRNPGVQKLSDPTLTSASNSLAATGSLRVCKTKSNNQTMQCRVLFCHLLCISMLWNWMPWVGCQSRLLPGGRGQIKGQLSVLKCMSLFERFSGILNFKTFFTLGPERFIILCSSIAAQTTLRVNFFRAVIIERIFKPVFPTLLSQYCGVSNYFHWCCDDINILTSN